MLDISKIYRSKFLDKKGKWLDFDFHWNFIQNYNWERDYHVGILEKLIKVYPNDKNFLETICRRMKYLRTSVDELKYFFDRYSWNNLPEIYDVYLSRFEQCIAQMTELIWYLIWFYSKKKNNYSGNKIVVFGDIGKFIVDPKSGLPNYYQKSINHSTLLSILLFIRNSTVHHYADLFYVKNKQRLIVKSKDIPFKERHGTLKIAIPDHILQNYNGKKILNSVISFKLPRFFIYGKIKLNKKKLSVNHEHKETVISFEADTLEFIERLVKKEFYGLFTDVLNILKAENNLE